MSVASLRGKDVLFVAFNDAKMSAIEFNPSTHSLETLSLHLYENDDIRKEFLLNSQPPQIHIEPTNKCVLFRYYGDCISVLPLRGKEEATSAPYQPSFRLDLFDEDIINIRDVVFLYDYYEPTLAILYEPKETCAGRLVSKKDTCCIKVVSIDLTKKRYALLSTITDLPYDAFKLLAVPKPLGGMLLLSQNAIISVDQSSAGFGIALNAFTCLATEYVLNQKFVDRNIVLHSPEIVFIDPFNLLLLTRGDMWHLRLKNEGRNVTDFGLERVGVTVKCSSICHLLEKYVFIGSTTGDSVIVQYEYSLESTVNALVADELDEEIYGASTSIATEKRLKLTLVDTLTTLGPIHGFAVGDAAEGLQIVACGGNDKSGHLSIIQNLRAEVLTSFNLSHCRDVWSVQQNESFHSYLVVSKKTSTMILSTGEELQQVENSGFYTAGPTVLVCVIRAFIVQIIKEGLIVLDFNAQKLTEKVVSDVSQDWIVSAQHIDNYIIIVHSSGTAQLWSLQENGTLVEERSINTHSAIQSISLVKDSIGLFCKHEEALALAGKDIHRGQNISANPVVSAAVDEDDIDMELYGEAMDVDKAENEILEEPVEEMQTTFREVAYYALILQSNGSFCILSLLDYSIVFETPYFYQLPPVVMDLPGKQSSSTYKSDLENVIGLMFGEDNCFIGIRSKQGDIYLYQVFRYLQSSDLHSFDLDSKRLAIRLKRVPHNALTRFPESNAELEDDISLSVVPFPNISGQSGFFTCGPRPAFAIYAPKTGLRLFPFTSDGAIRSFAPLHNVNFPHGFVYSNTEEVFRICQLPVSKFDLNLPHTTVSLRETPRHIVFHPKSQKYTLVTSTPSRARYVEEIEQARTGLDTILPEQLPIIDRYKLNLVAPGSWETIDSYQFADFEHVLCLRICSLDTKATKSGKKLFVVVGTSITKGEDTLTKGKVYVFDIVDVVPEPGKPYTNNKLKLLYSKEEKGPCSAVDAMHGHLVSSHGPKLNVRSFEDDENLVPCAFMDVQVSTTTISAIKNYALVGDFKRSISFVAFQENPPKMVQLGKDFNQFTVMATEFMIDMKQLLMIAADIDMNVHIFSYSPHHVSSQSGQKLIRRADFHLGTTIRTFYRMECKGSKERHFALYAAEDGSMGAFVPMEEKAYKRLLLLQHQLIHGFPHLAGLNPKSFRTIRSDIVALTDPARGVLDGDLLFQFVSEFGAIQQRYLTKRTGATIDKIYEDSIELANLVDRF